MPHIERFIYGMFQGKISQDKTPGLNALLSDKQIEYIRNLPLEANERYLIFWKEQVIAFPKIIKIFDEKSKRSWVQNETRFITFKDYFEATSIEKTLWQNQEFTELKELPDQFNAITV
jgi:hypothetical protein